MTVIITPGHMAMKTVTTLCCSVVIICAVTTEVNDDLAKCFLNIPSSPTCSEVGNCTGGQT